MSPLRSITVTLAAWAIALSSAFVSARPHDDDDRQGRGNRGRAERVERGEQSGRVERPRARVSLDQAVAMAERRFNARVVRADARASGDSVVYVLRLLNDSGRVWTVKVDAATGHMY